MRTEYAPITSRAARRKYNTHRIRFVCVQEVIPIKTRAELYSKEAMSLLSAVTMYPGILEPQLLGFYPGREDTIRRLLSRLIKQGRISRTENGGYTPYGAPPAGTDTHTVEALWILLDFIDRVEFHSASDFPTAIIFFAEGELYEIVPVPAGQEALVSHLLLRNRESPGRRIVLVDEPGQISSIDFPGISGFCTVDSSGQTAYYQKTNGGM